MNHQETLKALVYAQSIHVFHLYEQRMEQEQHIFNDKLQELGLTAFPYNMTAVHFLACIGQHEPVNNTVLAEKMNLSKAAITKISTKLLGDDYLKRSQLNDNKKEVYFSLTAKGRQVVEVHQLMHEIQEARFQDFLQAYSEPELQVVMNYLQSLGNFLSPARMK